MISGQTARLELLTSLEVQQLQESGQCMLILPTGATEQHGGHLPINTDTLIGERLCWAASSETKVPVLPALSYTVSSGHTSKWAGTFSLSHETFISTVSELAEWAVATGWKKLIIVNSHFGNNASLGVALEKIRLQYLGSLQVGVIHTFTLTEEIWTTFSTDVADLHANKAETDLMLHLAPELVKMEHAIDDPDRTGNCVFSYPVAQTSINGVTGSPSLGNAEDGEALFTQMCAALIQKITTALDEEPPLTAHYWQNLTK